jgi:hypothetical protein
MTKERGMMVMAVFGNIVSQAGRRFTNMPGIVRIHTASRMPHLAHWIHRQPADYAISGFIPKKQAPATQV